MTGHEQVVHVQLGPRSYEIQVGTGTLSRLGEFVAARSKVSHAVVITDEQVEEPYARAAAESLAGAAAAVDILVVPAGEATKSVEVAQDLWTKLLDLKADRKTLVVAVGGGVIGDLAGFVAATFAAGWPSCRCPRRCWRKSTVRWGARSA